MSSIYIETIGADSGKPDLVMLHGWAMHSGLMEDLALSLSGQFCVHLVDLPGHGNSQLNEAGFDINFIANDVYEQVSEKITGKASWLGWSLGGLVAMKIAMSFSDKIHKLVLIASNAAFVKQDNWPHAVETNVFEKFASDLQNDLKATISRFLSLQVSGTEDSRQTLKRLREIIFNRDLATKEALQMGLVLLEQTDLRSLFEEITIPALLIGGERDTLVPYQALNALAKKNNVEVNIIEKAGHAPFLSHLEQCSEAITGFLS